MLAKENMALLQQGCELSERLTDHQFCYEDEIAQSSIGKHLRHVLDFYRALLRSLPEKYGEHSEYSGKNQRDVLDYDHRLRDPALEAERTLWLESARNIQMQLSVLQKNIPEIPLEVISREGVNGCQSSVSSGLGRELQFLLAHTVHHYALISVALRCQKLDVPEGFGVSYSTRLYEQHFANA